MCIVDNMKKNAHIRINITLPEETVAMLDAIADKGTRSTFIDSAIRKQIHQLRKNGLRERLKAGAIERSGRDLVMAEEWFNLEEELWRK
jgi:CopG family transcriptional regulator / antitoxin EndoAI